MAITWGAYQNHVRLGIDVIMSPSSVGSSTSSVSLTVRTYVQMDSSSSMYYNGLTLSFSGSWSGSSPVNVDLGPGKSALVHSTTFTRSTSTSSQGQTFTGSLSHVFGSTAISRTFTIPARPAAPPSVPGTLMVSRNSDTSHTLNWSRTSTYTAVVIQRGIGDGKWIQVGRPTGNAYTFTDTTTKANARYYYRVAGVNSAGQSGWSNIVGPVYTTPAAPTAVTAERSGPSILITATAPSVYPVTYEVRDGSTVLSTNTSLPYTHSNPSLTVTHQYTVRAKIGALVGPWSAVSNLVQLSAPPAAPTALAPNGATSADDTALALTWQHNPVDSSKQTAAEIQYRLTGTTTWTTGTATTANTITVGALAAGVWEWQVRTKGVHANWSPWSAVATFTRVTVPGVAIMAPMDGVPWERPRLPIEWTWDQAQGRPQSSWQAALVETESGSQIDLLTGQGPETAATFSKRVADGGEYLVRVRAATGDIWSEWAEQIIEVAFVPPAVPDVDASWSEDDGANTIQWEPGAGLPPTVSVDIYRSVDEDIWELVAEGLPPEGSVQDFACLSFGETTYRVFAYADTGASSYADVTVLAESWAAWIGGGDSFQNVGRLIYDPELDLEDGRVRTMHRFEGREFGVPYSSGQLEGKVGCAGRIIDGDPAVATRQQLRAIAQDAAPMHLYRDPVIGRRVFGMLSSIQVKQAGFEVWTVSFSIEETGRQGA